MFNSTVNNTVGSIDNDNDYDAMKNPAFWMAFFVGVLFVVVGIVAALSAASATFPSLSGIYNRFSRLCDENFRINPGNHQLAPGNGAAQNVAARNAVQNQLVQDIVYRNLRVANTVSKASPRVAQMLAENPGILNKIIENVSSKDAVALQAAEEEKVPCGVIIHSAKEKTTEVEKGLVSSRPNPPSRRFTFIESIANIFRNNNTERAPEEIAMI